MPFKSEAQRRKFYELFEKGLISKELLDEYENSTGGKKLPERVLVKPKKEKEPKNKVWFAKVIK
jgi:hypothetical protein